MKIALVGYGQMGHMIEQCAKKFGHEVVATIDPIAADASVKIPQSVTNRCECQTRMNVPINRTSESGSVFSCQQTYEQDP